MFGGASDSREVRGVTPRSAVRSAETVPKTPQYRQRAGYSQAIVTLTDAKTKKRRDYWLGEINSLESREKYHIVIAAWEAKGRCFLDAGDPSNPRRALLGGTRIG